MGEKVFQNGAIAQGAGEGVHITNSQRVKLINNSIHDFVKYGVFAENAANFRLENNILSGVIPDDERGRYDTTSFIWEIQNGGFDLAKGNAMTVINNTVSGT